MAIEKSSNLRLAGIEFQKMISNFGPDVMRKVTSNLRDVGDGGNSLEPVPSEITIKEAFENYFSGVESSFNFLSKSSQKTYRSESSVFLEFCKKNAEQGMNTSIQLVLSPVFLFEYVRGYKNKCTRNKKIAFFRTLIKEECITGLTNKKVNSLFRIPLKLYKKSQLVTVPKYFTPEQEEEVLLLSRKTCNALRNYSILNVFLSTGIRLDELINLKIKDIFEDQLIIMIFAKGNKENEDEENEFNQEAQKEIRHITKHGMDVLKEFIRFIFGVVDCQKAAYDLKELFIFSAKTDHKSACSASTIQYMVKGLITSAKTIPTEMEKRLTVHSFRHTFAVRLLFAGVSIYNISKLLGHKTIGATEEYLQLFKEDLRKEIEKHPLANLNDDFMFLKRGDL